MSYQILVTEDTATTNQDHLQQESSNIESTYRGRIYSCLHRSGANIDFSFIIGVPAGLGGGCVVGLGIGALAGNSLAWAAGGAVIGTCVGGPVGGVFACAVGIILHRWC